MNVDNKSVDEIISAEVEKYEKVDSYFLMMLI